jgi:AcrR family transcriptional regulator
MPIIVNKEDKIKEICYKAYEQFILYGIEEISLNKLIENIGISKGQFYHYFKTKEELIFEVISQKTLEAVTLYEKQLQMSKTLSESLHILFSVYVNDDKYSQELRKLMFDSLHLFINSEDEKIKQYNKDLYNWMDNKLIELFNKYEIYQSDIFIKSISATADGMYIRSLSSTEYDLQLNLSNYLSDLSNIIYKG